MNMQEIMRQAKRMQKRMEEAREQAGAKTVEGSAGGGMVVVTANGRSEIVSVKIEKDVVDPDEIEMLQDLVVAATNQAIQRANEMMNEEIGKVTGGLPIPGMF
ncbi:MAG: YbaB/EbfC family nucleoid-associated protein [Myxococcales bacterium]|nr:YbaB/EbfC family nucleoid-associated protein [Myxococcales bacterium]MCB9646444.1 YbaB/EbfC family nucleoid-associated protein [Deltaproteobacteria bacterium]